MLCERAAYATPTTAPQAHNPLGIPAAGARLQEAGLLVTVNELAVAFTRDGLWCSSPRIDSKVNPPERHHSTRSRRARPHSPCRRISQTCRRNHTDEEIGAAMTTTRRPEGRSASTGPNTLLTHTAVHDLAARGFADLTSAYCLDREVQRGDGRRLSRLARGRLSTARRDSGRAPSNDRPWLTWNLPTASDHLAASRSRRGAASRFP